MAGRAVSPDGGEGHRTRDSLVSIYAVDLPTQAVDAHDRARDLPAEMWGELIADLAALVRPQGTVLDIGIGSGAVGERLASAGVDVMGLDSNASMIAALQASPDALPVVRGDAQSLPFGDGAFAVTVLACVLHLIPDWKLALQEAIRVTEASGHLAVNIGQSALAGRTGISRTFLEELRSRVDLPPMPGPSGMEEVEQTLTAEGCVRLPDLEVRGTALRAVEDQIFRLEWNPFGWPPGIPQAALSAAAEHTRSVARQHFGSLDRRSEVAVALGFQVFKTPPLP